MNKEELQLQNHIVILHTCFVRLKWITFMAAKHFGSKQKSIEKAAKNQSHRHHYLNDEYKRNHFLFWNLFLGCQYAQTQNYSLSMHMLKIAYSTWSKWPTTTVQSTSLGCLQQIFLAFELTCDLRSCKKISHFNDKINFSFLLSRKKMKYHCIIIKSRSSSKRK